jgi:hypothetical protein
MSSIDPAIASVIAAKQSAVQSQIAVALADKSLDAAKQQADALVQLMSSAGATGKAVGRGGQFDATA